MLSLHRDGTSSRAQGSPPTAVLRAPTPGWPPAAVMIKAILIFNNHGKPRLSKFYEHYVSSLSPCCRFPKPAYCAWEVGHGTFRLPGFVRAFSRGGPGAGRTRSGSLLSGNDAAKCRDGTVPPPMSPSGCAAVRDVSVNNTSLMSGCLGWLFRLESSCFAGTEKRLLSLRHMSRHKSLVSVSCSPLQPHLTLSGSTSSCYSQYLATLACQISLAHRADAWLGETLRWVKLSEAGLPPPPPHHECFHFSVSAACPLFNTAATKSSLLLNLAPSLQSFISELNSSPHYRSTCLFPPRSVAWIMWRVRAGLKEDTCCESRQRLRHKTKLQVFCHFLKPNIGKC